MGNNDFDPSASRRSPAFKRLSSTKAASQSVDPSDNRSSKGSLRASIFNQVQVSKSSPKGEAYFDSKLARLGDAADSNIASAATLHSLFDTSREIQDANISASAASVKEVDAAVRLAEELRERIVENERTAGDAHAQRLNRATVERLLRS
ncbi:MAG: hypothetical protein RL518_2470 [Pseudomonadota bacterium]